MNVRFQPNMSFKAHKSKQCPIPKITYQLVVNSLDWNTSVTTPVFMFLITKYKPNIFKCPLAYIGFHVFDFCLTFLNYFSEIWNVEQ